MLLLASLMLLVAAPAAALTIGSSAFEPGGSIPAEYTCEGVDVSPELHWSGAPANTKSFVLILEDPDVPDPAAPQRTWVHWVLYDLPADAAGLPRDVAYEELPGGTRQGANDWKRAGYGGPCPPIGRHRYVFELYALSAKLGDLGPASAAALEKAMAGRVLARAKLVGTYAKTGPQR